MFKFQPENYVSSQMSEVLSRLNLLPQDIRKKIKKISKHLDGMRVEAVVIILLGLIDYILSTSTELQRNLFILENLLHNCNLMHEKLMELKTFTTEEKH